MKKRTVLKALSLLVLLTSLLSACQPPPEQSVISKNDGTFEEAVRTTAGENTATHSEGRNSVWTEILSLEDTVENANGTVAVHIQLDEQNVYSGPFPVVQVRPHNITVEEAQTIAKALFGDTELYEGSIDPPMTAEIAEEKLLLWRQLANEEEISALYGKQRLNDEKKSIHALLDAMEINSLDSSEKEPVLCDWKFHPESYYSSLKMSPSSQATENQTIIASAKMDNIDYKYWLTCRDEADFRVQNISAFVSSIYSSPHDIETLHMVHTLCTAKKPTEEELVIARTAAENMLNAMGLSDSWMINNVNAENYKYWKNSEEPAYVISISAVPTYNGVPCLHVPQLESLKTEDAYAPNYYYSEWTLSLSPNGNLIDMNLKSPLDVVAEVNSNVKIIEWERVIELLENYLKNTEPAFFDDSIGMIDGAKIDIEINRIHVGLARIRIKDNQSDFYLVPAIQFSGDYEIMLNGERIYSYSDFYGGEKDFAVVNLIDGSIINTELGY